MKRSSFRLATVAAGAAALALIAAGCGSSGSSSSSSTTATPSTTAAAPATTTAATGGPVNVVLNEWKIVPDPTSAKAGKVTFDVKNTGSATHEMVVIKTAKGAADLGKGSRVPETGSAGETGDIPAGGTKKVTLNLKAGHYVLICNIAGHYSAGMHTDFTVN